MEAGFRRRRRPPPPSPQLLLLERSERGDFPETGPPSIPSLSITNILKHESGGRAGGGGGRLQQH